MTSNKMYELKIYNKVIDNLIYRNRQHKAINKELQNLNFYQIQCCEELPSRKKVIEYKQVFKVKYKPNTTLEKYKVWLVAQDFSQVLKKDFTKIFISTNR